ncbi:LysR substrate-binding domain-containing protein [Anderseniella sp. Alg231-50]|uniref:LysR substrate-binding domain-containing protein n=1 Tax=Anderseniella sp. Alg231-50 TaxID=1922226 RepID=UPI000D555A6A
MRFRHFDNLRVFNIVAEHGSFSSAAEELHLTKGAVSHQIRQLEAVLGFDLFKRLPRGISLTPKGRDLLAATQSAFEGVEKKISELQLSKSRTLTIGVTTYFASRWLSPRLMDFMRAHPDIRLRVQPMIDLHNLKAEGVDLAIRWGNGAWSDVRIEKLFTCPAWPCGDADALSQVRELGLEAAFENYTLLRDREDSTAWSQWFEAAGLAYMRRTDTLIIPDPNVRVQAVIDGQGVALNDALVETEIEAGRLHRLSDVELSDFGYYLAYPSDAASNPDVEAFADWLKQVV